MTSVRTRSVTKSDRQILEPSLPVLPNDDVCIRVEPLPNDQTVDSDETVNDIVVNMIVEPKRDDLPVSTQPSISSLKTKSEISHKSTRSHVSSRTHATNFTRGSNTSSAMRAHELELRKLDLEEKRIAAQQQSEDNRLAAEL